MRFVALLRRINVGKSVQVSMKDLKSTFEINGFENVATYINSGNILFDSNKEIDLISKEVSNLLKNKYEQDIRTLILDKNKVITIANSIPGDWMNDDKQKTDVAYLFNEINNENIIDNLPVKKEFMKLLYVDGALIWNVSRTEYNKSQLNKIISHKIYKSMTVRNVNTARYLASAL
jgi:uncharacterized protein (DUF1697 family)